MANIKRANASGITKAGAAISDVPDAPTIGTATDAGTGTSVSVTFTAAATNVVLTATDTFGRTGQSNAFNVVPVTLDHFDWTGLPPSGTVNALLSGTATAKDDTNAVSDRKSTRLNSSH